MLEELTRSLDAPFNPNEPPTPGLTAGRRSPDPGGDRVGAGWFVSMAGFADAARRPPPLRRIDLGEES